MAQGGGYSGALSVSDASPSAANSTSPISIVDNSSFGTSKPTTSIALYLMLAVFGLIAVWIIYPRK